MATSRVIAAMFKSKFGDSLTLPKAMELQHMVLEELRMSSSYMKCYRAAEKAFGDVRGTNDGLYRKLAEYLHKIKISNPGMVTALETKTYDGGDERFLYAFLAFGASIQGFRRVKPVMILDGMHLSRKYKGVLLTASGQDANFEVFPLTFAVVDSENEDSCTWFLRKVERIMADSANLTLI